MSSEPTAFEQSSLAVPPSYEQCVMVVEEPRRIEFVVSPLAMAALLAWDEDED